MNKLFFRLYVFVIIFSSCTDDKKDITSEKSCNSLEEERKIPEEALKLMRNYSQITNFKDNYLFFRDGDSLIFDDKIKKSIDELMNAPSIKDMFTFPYVKGEEYLIEKENDPGRIRNIDFFKKIYGSTKEKVQDSLVKIIWCPKTINQAIYATKINNVAEKLQLISEVLDNKPHLTKYIKNPGGTFNWRNILNTDRLSMHSFGMTIDINVDFSDYWQWSCQCNDEKEPLNYINRIPIEIVEIFEQEGFIWGGKWYHFDTMHFEYRPELLD